MFNKLKNGKRRGILKSISLLVFDLILVGYYAFPEGGLSTLTHFLGTLK